MSTYMYVEAIGPAVIPPRYIIDLSLPPEERYKHVAKKYSTKLRSLTSLFDGLLLDLRLPESLLPIINKASRLILRKVHDDEQTRELRGISQTIGVPMYLLVAYNVVLDLLMGCTSGGVLSRESRRPQSTARMLHFRTLDWGMDPLRKVIVQMDFVQSASANPERILASSITYVGFVGILTGVKPGLSISLNFRAVHDASTHKKQFRFYFHHLLVLLGRRPSIASLLRSYLLPTMRAPNDIDDPLESSLADQACARLLSHHTTAAYVVLSDGKQTHIIEKDYDRSQIATSNTFIARTNHDVCTWSSTSSGDVSSDNTSEVPIVTAGNYSAENSLRHYPAGLNDFLDESGNRLECLESKWKRRVKQLGDRARREKGQSTFEENEAYVTKDELARWVSAYTTTNECTHFAAIMDPVAGEVLWCQAYPKPLRAPDS